MRLLERRQSPVEKKPGGFICFKGPKHGFFHWQPLTLGSIEGRALRTRVT